MRRVAFVAALCLIGVLTVRLLPSARGDDVVGQASERGRALASHWQSDARLVQVVVSGFGFAMGANGVPDVTKAGPPGNAVLYFYSPSAEKYFEVTALLNLTAEQRKMMKQFGQDEMRGRPVDDSVSPFTLALPSGLVGFDRALAEARSAGLDKACAGANPMISSCGKATQAELHLYWSGEGESGTPVWTFAFGQHPTTLKTVTRQVDASAGKVVAIADKQATTLDIAEDDPAAQRRSLSIGGERDFMTLARLAHDGMAKLDPLYKLYAVAVVLGLDENQATPNAKVRLAEAHFEFARTTPSRYWDNREVRVDFPTGRQGTILYLPATRMAAPQQRKPVPIDFAKMPDADPFLRAIVKQFPRDYREQWTTYENGCEREMSISPSIHVTRCGVLIPIKHYTDRIYLWLQRTGNPYWYAQNGPSEPEFAFVSRHSPGHDWVWWGRVKHAEQWRYEIMDVDTRKEIVGCTAPALDPTREPAAVACSG
ncbi:MAG TPA: hypothetical protein VFA50_14835 [Stellaceae bacterium]|nr:hypothetical protein [Stellaceae bacterium]